MSNLDERRPQENTKEEVTNFIWQHNLISYMGSAQEVYDNIEYAYRIGNEQNATRERQILIRFYNKEIRNEMVRNARRKTTVDRLRPVYVQDDLTTLDMERKKEGGNFMLECHHKRYEPKFINGAFQIKVSGNTIDLSIEDVRYYNRGMDLEKLIRWKWEKIREERGKRQGTTGYRKGARQDTTDRSQGEFRARKLNTPIKERLEEARRHIRGRIPSEEEIQQEKRKNPDQNQANTQKYIAEVEYQVENMKQFQRILSTQV
jgi:hypothetical protein